MPRPRAELELERMLAVMRHESFYTVRTWIDEELGVYVGWVARSGSFADSEAVRDGSGDVVVVFSGEEYSAESADPAWRARSGDCGAYQLGHLVDAYRADARFPSTLNGRFHGVTVDRRRGTATVFTDRYGMHRLYFHQADDDAVYFSAEAKSILAARPELRAIDERALGESIVLGCVLENRTLFKGIDVLPGATRWEFRGGRPAARRSYFSPREWEEQERLSPERFYEELREVFSRRLPRYFDGPEPVGMSLTGGLDTRMIMAWQRCAAGSLPCYTWGGTYRDCQDVVIARAVARACGQPYEVVTVGREFLSRFSHYANKAVHLTDGCVDVSAAADVYMNEQARSIAPVRMTGLYGGEVLRHVRSFKPILPLPGLFASDMHAWFARACSTYDEVARTHPISFGVFRQAPWHHHGNLALEQTQITMRSPFLDNEIVRTVFRAPDSACASDHVSLRLIADGNPALARIPTDRGIGGGRGRIAERMHHGWQEFTFKAEYAYDYGMPQWLARVDHALSPLRLQRLVLGRHKALHYRTWYCQELAEFVRDVLLDRKGLERPYVDRRTLERIVADHTGGRRNYTWEIHKLLTLELVHRNLIDRSPTSTGSRAELVSVS